MLLFLTASGFTWVSKAQFRAGTSMRSERSDVDKRTDPTAFSTYFFDVTTQSMFKGQWGPHMAPLGKTSMRTFKTETQDVLICTQIREV